MMMRLLFLASLMGATAFVPSNMIRRAAVSTTSRYKSTLDVNGVIKTDYMPDSLLPPPRNRAAIASNRLSPMEIQRAIVDVKRFVENRLETDLNLIKASTKRISTASEKTLLGTHRDFVCILS